MRNKPNRSDGLLQGIVAFAIIVCAILGNIKEGIIFFIIHVFVSIICSKEEDNIFSKKFIISEIIVLALLVVISIFRILLI